MGAAPDALLSHIVAQLESNVNFLVDQGYLNRADATAFVAKLPSSSTTNVNGVIPKVPATPARPAYPQARALWAYNENGQDTDDLSFPAGATIEIIDETNADWWTGRVQGTQRQALFPTAYVEKIAPSATLTPAPRTPYRPFGAALHGQDVPPPVGAGTNSVGLQEKPGTEEKKGKFGKYKETMAHSAAGGVGFGAGAAIGGGLVRAIF